MSARACTCDTLALTARIFSYMGLRQTRDLDLTRSVLSGAAPAPVPSAAGPAAGSGPTASIRPDLQRVLDRHAIAQEPTGPMPWRDADDLRRNTPADRLVCGIGSINASLFGAERAQAVVMACDATVLAGTHGMCNHQKTDHLLDIALQSRLPVVLFAEGGGGRSGAPAIGAW